MNIFLKKLQNRFLKNINRTLNSIDLNKKITLVAYNVISHI